MTPLIVDERDVEQEAFADCFRVWSRDELGALTVYDMGDATLSQSIAWATAQDFATWSLAAMVRLPDGFTALWLIGRDPSDKSSSARSI